MGAHAELEAKVMGKVKVSHNIMSNHTRTTDRIEQAIKLSKTKPIPNPLIKRNAFIAPIKMAEKLGEGFRRTTYNFRRLSRAEVKDIYSLKVYLTKVWTEDSVKSLSKQMPFTKFKH
jgi:hypothetical protein